MFAIIWKALVSIFHSIFELGGPVAEVISTYIPWDYPSIMLLILYDRYVFVLSLALRSTLRHFEYRYSSHSTFHCTHLTFDDRLFSCFIHYYILVPKRSVITISTHSAKDQDRVWSFRGNKLHWSLLANNPLLSTPETSNIAIKILQSTQI